MTTKRFARTYSATARHIIKPEDGSRVLCGGRVSIEEFYRGADGQPHALAAWMCRDLPPCQRCERSAAKRGMTEE